MLPGLQQKVNGGEGVARRPPIRRLYLQVRAENFAVPTALRMGLQLQAGNQLPGALFTGAAGLDHGRSLPQVR